MIPKKIHYCWFGGNPLPEKETKCMKSWEEILPDYTIKCWNENNSPLDHPFVSKMYKKKQWAFVSDYVRLYALYNEGGIYLDTDMEVLKSLNDLLKYNCFLGFESQFFVNAAIIGSISNHIFLKQCLEKYQNLKYEVNIPKIVTKVLIDNGLRSYKNQVVGEVNLFTSEYFYPWPYQTDFEESMIKEKSLTIHHWSKNWKVNKNIFQKIITKIRK